MTDLCAIMAQQAIDKFGLTTTSAWKVSEFGEEWEWLGRDKSLEIEAYLKEKIESLTSMEIVSHLESTTCNYVDHYKDPTAGMCGNENSWQDVLASMLLTTVSVLIEKAIPAPETDPWEAAQ